jgi:hypothetical protein
MHPPRRPTLTQNQEPQGFGRRASDRGFAEPKTWFGRRAGDKKAAVKHSLPFAAQIAAQIAPGAKARAKAPAYGAPRPIRAGLVKDFEA